ncbi:hypothetical protein GCM10009825_32030 [Arthrobacter humicola]|uniref:Uncharacterized protein n=1 Tax=Arthrobacter humicola TaxID=409291 RepID=A0ABN2ZHX5_9MICC
MVPFNQRLGPDWLAGMDVVLHDGAQHFEFAWFAHAPPPIDGPAAGAAPGPFGSRPRVLRGRSVTGQGLALDMPKC